MSERERLSDMRLGNKNDTNEQSQLTGRVLWINGSEPHGYQAQSGLTQGGRACLHPSQ